MFRKKINKILENLWKYISTYENILFLRILRKLELYSIKKIIIITYRINNQKFLKKIIQFHFRSKRFWKNWKREQKYYFQNKKLSDRNQHKSEISFQFLPKTDIILIWDKMSNNCKKENYYNSSSALGNADACIYQIFTAGGRKTTTTTTTRRKIKFQRYPRKWHHLFIFRSHP